MKPLKKFNLYRKAYNPIDICKNLRGLQYFKQPLKNLLQKKVPLFYEVLVEPCGGLIKVIIFHTVSEEESFKSQELNQEIKELASHFFVLPLEVSYFQVRRMLDHPKYLFYELTRNSQKATFNKVIKLKDKLDSRPISGVKGIFIRIKGKKKDRKELKKVYINSPAKHNQSYNNNLMKRNYNTESNIGSMGIKIVVYKTRNTPKSLEDVTTCTIRNVSNYITPNEIEIFSRNELQKQ